MGYEPWAPSEEMREKFRTGLLTITDVAPKWEAEKTKARKPRRNAEFVLQCSAVKQLRAILATGYIVASHCAEGASLSEGSRSKMQGQIKGFPDTQILGDGRAWFIEWKSETGVTSPDQRRVHADLRAAGHVVVTARSIETAVTFLRENGARFRGALA